MRRLICAASVAFAFSFTLAHCKAADSPALRWVTNSTDANRWSVEVSGVGTQLAAEQWPKLLTVQVEQNAVLEDIGIPAMLGEYRFASDRLTFTPRFPLEPGTTYRATFWPPRTREGKTFSKPVTARLSVPTTAQGPTTVVSQVYPTADSLPENLLKFYIHFSAPMSRGHVYDFIHLRDESGKPVELPFLELDEELWNPAMTRLTVFIDPGRIKRGVTPLEEVGPALEAGKRFSLVIDSQWRDSRDQPLKQNFQKSFTVVAPDREPPDPATWQIIPPEDAKKPLTIRFPEPMDHALAQRVIQIHNHTGKPISGEATLADAERLWTFSPTAPWHSGPHKIVVQTTIEDLAGNNIGKRFEVDVFDGVQRRLTRSTVSLPFSIE
jgi:hypothetical protein